MPRGKAGRVGVVSTLWLGMLILAILVAGCARQAFPELPGLPEELREIPDVLKGLDLPNLGDVGIPEIGSLPALTPPEGAIVFNGPLLRRVKADEVVPATDINFAGVEDGMAVFTILGMRSPRQVGDSIDYSGEWPGVPGSRYDVRLRIFWIGDDSVRLAGVHQLLIPDLAPTMGDAPEGATTLQFPFTNGVSVGDDTISGTTLGYLGRYERGAQFTALPENEYPYRQVGDSLVWTGSLRPGIGAEYDLRVLRYGREGARVGGIVKVHLPSQ